MTRPAGILDLDATGALLRQHAGDALAQRGRFDLVVPGGRGPLPLFAALRATGEVGPGWRIHLSDERCVPHDDPRRNAPGIARALGLDVEDARLVSPPWSGDDDADAAAYASRLADVDVFDLVLLNLRSDGHTASLFPDDPAGVAPDAADALAVEVTHAEPPRRITLSAPRLRRARTIVFVVAGDDKAVAFERVAAGADEALPTGALHGPTRWVADLR